MRGRLVSGAFVAGSAALLQVGHLPGPERLAQCAAVCAVLCALYGSLRHRSRWALVLLMVASAMAGFVHAGWRAQLRLDDALACVHRNHVTRLTLRITGLPTGTDQARRFDAQVLPNASYCNGTASACARMPRDLSGIPRDIRVSWRVPMRSQGRLPEILPGQVWRMALRLRAPHAARNPYGPDIEGRLFAQGVRAVGSVRGLPVLLADDPGASIAARVARVRHALRAALYLVLGDKAYAPILVALALGDQSALPREDWIMLSRAGISHLVAISGLHVGLVAGLAAAGAGFVFRRVRLARQRVTQAVPTQIAMAIAAWLAAALYCTLAGWGIPARRVFLMLSTVALAVIWRVPMSASRTLALAAVTIVLIDPWAPLAMGFWLSFAAVGALMMAAASARPGVPRHDSSAPTGDPTHVAQLAREGIWVHIRSLWTNRQLFRAVRSRMPAAVSSPDDLTYLEDVPPSRAESWRSLVRAIAARAARWSSNAARLQGLLTMALAPLLAVTIGQVSMVSPLVNAFAIPIIGVVVTPMALACAALAGAGAVGMPGASPLARWVGTGAHAVLAPTLDAARVMSASQSAVWSVAAAPWPYGLLALGCAVWALMPPGAPGRRLAWCGVLPLLFWRPAPIPAGAWDLVALDVGQAGAAVVMTRHHLVVFDTGPRYDSGDDAGARTLVPFLQAIGRDRVDRLIVSHAHLDHAGGVRGLMNGAHIARSHAPFDLNRHLQREAAMHYGGEPARGWPLAVNRCEAGQQWTYDGVTFSFAHPPVGRRFTFAQANASSCVLVVRGAHHSAVLPGDIGAREERSIAADIGRVDVALVAHHGSSTSSSAQWIDALSVRHAIAQAGYYSPFGHPAPRVQQRWIARGAAFWRNDLDGAVWVTSREKGLGVQAWRDQGRRYWHEPLNARAGDRCEAPARAGREASAAAGADASAAQGTDAFAAQGAAAFAGQGAAAFAAQGVAAFAAQGAAAFAAQATAAFIASGTGAPAGETATGAPVRAATDALR